MYMVEWFMSLLLKDNVRNGAKIQVVRKYLNHRNE